MHHDSFRTFLVATALASLACFGSGSANAQQTGFAPGELVLYTPALHGASSISGGVVRIDPLTGMVTPVVDFGGSTQLVGGGICYDPYRDRLLFVGSLAINTPKKLFTCDALGNLTDLGFDNRTFAGLSPASGGRIYMLESSPTQGLRFLDANNALQTVMDASGSGPWVAPNWNIRTMIYDPGTNALIMLTSAGNAWSCGPVVYTHVHRMNLSADGTRVISEGFCLPIHADVSGANVPVGVSRTPNGQVLVVMDTNSNATQPRMQWIDPVAGTASTFASNGHPFAAATNAGTYSSALGRAVILDTGGDFLRTFALGEVGAGTVLMPSSQISAGGSTGESATLIEIPTNSAAGLFGKYCSAKTSSSGCVPTMAALGTPSASQPTGFLLDATQVEAMRFGLLFYGQSGPASTPFLGGTLCVAAQIQRTPAQFSGGAAACSGAFSYDFNARVASGIDPTLQAGSVVQAQYWFRDPQDSFGVGLTDAVTFTIAP